jgi:integrase
MNTNPVNLSELVERYISYRQALGERFVSSAFILRAFARSTGPQLAIGDVKADQVSAFLSGVGSQTNTWHIKYGALKGFYNFAKTRGHVDDIPLPDELPKRVPSLVPYIYSHEELRCMLDMARGYQRGLSSFTPPTFRTILLLLYGTGLRAGEVVRLNVADVDFNDSLLVIRGSKFHKSRLVPFGPQIRQALKEYTSQRTPTMKARSEDSPFFTTRHGTRVILNTLQAHFRRLRALANIRRDDGASYQPRLHDLRHTFAVHRLTSWYQQGKDVQKLVHQLSVYLGHDHLQDTQVYLSMTPDLLREANTRFEHYVQMGGQP